MMAARPKIFGRRAILKGIGISPAAAAALVSQAEMSLAGAQLGHGLPLGAPLGSPQPGGLGGSGHTFYSFASWLTGGGEKKIRLDARQVYAIDPDLVERRLPLNTKFRLQRDRNYQRLLEARQEWFQEIMSRYGHVEWWP